MSDQSQQPPQFQPPHQFEENTISLTSILLIFARQIKIIIIIPSILCTLTIINVLYFVQPVYVSTAKIMSSSSSRDNSQAAGFAAQFGINLPTDQSRKQWVYSEIVKSRTLARAMLKRNFDTEKYGHQKPLLQILTYGNEGPTVGIDTLTKAGVDAVINMIDINKNDSFYDLTINGPEPLFVRDFAAALIEELDKNQREYNKAKTGETRMFIEERIADTRLELESAEETLRDFIDRNRRIENSPALQLERQRLSREVTVLTGVFTTLKQQLETTKIEEVKELDYVVVLDPPEAPMFPSKPNKKALVILAGILGISLGMVFGFILEYSENIEGEEKEKMGKVKSLLIKNIMDFIPNYFLRK